VGEEGIPPELDEATLAVEDAYINYLDSCKKMRQLALSRGFYPMVAVDLNDSDFGGRGSGKSFGKSRNMRSGKGKGKSKGKGGGKSWKELELDTLCLEPEDSSLAEDLHRRTTHRHPRRQSRLQVEAVHNMGHGSNDTDFHQGSP